MLDVLHMTSNKTDVQKPRLQKKMILKVEGE
jgi:hypothetical protein